jgi:hypothetical protein
MLSRDRFPCHGDLDLRRAHWSLRCVPHRLVSTLTLSVRVKGARAEEGSGSAEG